MAVEEQGLKVYIDGGDTVLKTMQNITKSIEQFQKAASSAGGSIGSFGSATSAASKEAQTLEQKQAAANLAMARAQVVAVQAAQAASQLAQAQSQLAIAEKNHEAAGNDATGMAVRQARANVESIQAAANVKAALAGVAQANAQAATSSGQATTATNQQAQAQAQAGSSGKTFSEVMGNVKTTVSNVAGAIGTAASGFISFAGQALGGAVTGAGNLLSKIGPLASGLLDLGGRAAGAAISGIKGVIDKLIEAGAKAVEFTAHIVEAGAKSAVAFSKTSVKAYSDFSQTISEIGAVSGATSGELKQMEDKALEIGAKLPLSAKDAAQGMSELAKAGFDAKASLGAAQSVALLSTATNYGMEKSASILTSTIQGFNLDISTSEKATASATRVVDLLAKTANASSVDVSDLGQTFKYVAPVAAGAGYSIEDMSKAIGLLGNAGIKGSQAGTSLRSIITRLAAPPKDAAAAIETLGLKIHDASGNMVPFQDIVVQLREKFSKLSQVEKIDFAKKLGGQEAMSSLLALTNATPESFKAMSDAIDNATGSANDMSKAMTDNLYGATENMKGSIETLQIKIGKALAPALTIAYNKIADLANAAGPLADMLGVKVTEAVGKAKRSIDEFRAGFTGKPIVFEGSAIITPFTQIGKVARELKGPLAQVEQAIIHLFNVAFGRPLKNDSLEGFQKQLQASQPPLQGFVNFVEQKLIPGIERVAIVINNLAATFGPFIQKAVQLYEILSPMSIIFDTLKGALTGGLDGALQAVGDHVSELGLFFGVDLTGAVQGVIGFIENQLIPAFGQVATWVTGTLIPAVLNFANQAIPILTNAFNTVSTFVTGTLLPGLVTFGNWLGSTFGPIWDSLAKTVQTTILPAVMQFGAWVVNNLLPSLGQLAQYMGQTLGPVIEKVAGFIADPLIPFIGNLINTILNSVIPTLKNWAEVLGNVVGPIITKVAGFVTDTLVPAVSTIVKWINDNVIPAFNQIAKVINDPVMPVLKVIASYLGGGLSTAFSNIETLVKGVWNAISTVIGTVWGTIKGIWETIIKLLQGDFSGAFTTAQKTVEGVWNGIGSIISTIWTTIQGVWNNIINFLSGSLGKAFTDFKTSVEGVWNGIVSAISTAWTNILAAGNNALKWFGDLPGNIVKAIGDVGGLLLGAGKSLIDGLIRGIQSIHIPMPHFTAGVRDTQVGPVTVPLPYVDISWYAKGGLFKMPQVIGIGDSPGGEAALPIRSIEPMILTAMQKAAPVLLEALNSRVDPVASASQIISNAYSATTYDQRQMNLIVNSPERVNPVQAGYDMARVMGAW